MDVFEAAYRVAHDYQPAGAVGLARALGKNPGTLLNEINPHQETHKLGLGDAVLMSTATGDTRILEAFAATLQHVVVPLPAKGFACDTELIALILKRDQKAGEFARTLDAALADGRISRAEAQQLKHWGLKMVQSMMQLITRLEGMADD